MNFWGVGSQSGEPAFESEAALREQMGCHPVIARLLWNRGVRGEREVSRIFNPQVADLPDPLQIVDMKRAVLRVADAVARHECIALYGDYDVDGTCGISLLATFLRQLGEEPLIYQPDRFSEGYGVHTAAVTGLFDRGAKVVLTVDCGITAVEPAQALRKLGADLIIIDHHKVGAELPDAFAVVDPQRQEDSSGLRNLCGTGLAFFFAMALRTELRARGFFTESKPEPNLLKLLDLVAVATVADVVDIRGVNRILVSHGLRVLGREPRIGFKALLESAGVKRPTAMACGFSIGPRINAAGRLKHARAAFDLLTSGDPDAARKLASELETLNTDRRSAQDSVAAMAREQALAQIGDPRWLALAEDKDRTGVPWPRTLVLAANDGDTSWHEGVVGIVASKMVDEFGRPAFVLAAREGDPDTLKGSVRSFGKIDIISVISDPSVSTHLLNFGGHAHAGGVSLRRWKLDEFRDAINSLMARTLDASHFQRERRFDAEIAIEEIDAKLVDEIGRLEPFGQGFPEPVFKLTNTSAKNVQILKEKHLKMRFGGSSLIDGVWFNAFREPRVTADLDRLRSGSPCSMWVSPQWNEWQGVRKLQLQIKHIDLN